MSDLIERLEDRALGLSEGPMFSTVEAQVEWEAAQHIRWLESELAKTKETMGWYEKQAQLVKRYVELTKSSIELFSEFEKDLRDEV